ncbi:LexA family protein [Streptomyces millisiae]|uniref:LexA repressor DNA-binding domain-containing protein n=1 Tax=Streptomyces millisiae TaxID=3075542 RepID=A0ABU2LWD6_9ACTN|nr:hypothetical protein [Streptomyces sp. DSM 44918]MDT0321906.1 hypothetical protein [Streptomyces sp. DSM 44918]
MTTDRQDRILHTIRDQIADRGEAPTIREIGRRVGLSSPSSVLYHLWQMGRQGVIRRSGQGRSLRYLPHR